MCFLEDLLSIQLDPNVSSKTPAGGEFKIFLTSY